MPATTFTMSADNDAHPTDLRDIILPTGGRLVILGDYVGQSGGFQFYLDENLIADRGLPGVSQGAFMLSSAVAAGLHRFTCRKTGGDYSVRVTVTLLLAHGDLEVTTP